MSNPNRPRRRAIVLAYAGASSIPAVALLDGAWTWLDAGRLPPAGALSAQIWSSLIVLVALALFGATPSGRRFLAGHACQIVALILAAGIAFAIGEAVVRRGSHVPDFHLRAPGAVYEFSPDPYVLPGAKGVARHSINSDGLRGAEVPTNADGFRILCVGGGTTECLYVDDTECWPALLQAELQRRGLDKVWVGSAGHADFGTAQHAEFLRVSPLVDRVQCVLCQVGVNDLLRLLLDESLEAVPRTWLRRTAIARQIDDLLGYRSPRGLLVDADGRGLVEGRLTLQFTQRELDMKGAVDEFGARVRRMIERARDRGVEIIFVTQPVLWEDFPRPAAADVLRYARLKPEPRDWPMLTPAACRAAMDRYNARVVEVCGEEGVPVIDAAAVNGLENGYFDDCHLNRLGCSDLANILAAWFERRWTSSPTDHPAGSPSTPNNPALDSLAEIGALDPDLAASRPATALLARRRIEEQIRLAPDQKARDEAIARRDALDRSIQQAGLLAAAGDPEFERELFAAPGGSAEPPTPEGAKADPPPPEPVGPWRLSVSGAEQAVLVPLDDSGETVRVEIPKADSPDQWRIQLQWPLTEVTEKEGYRIRFRARAEAPRSLVAVCAQSEPPFDVLGLWKEMKLDSEWRNFEADFQATKSELAARVQFYLGGSSIPVEVANFVIERAASLPPPKKRGWKLVVGPNAGAEQSTSTPEHQRIEIHEPGSDVFSLQLRGDDHEFAAGRLYRVHFRARADKPRKAVCTLTEANPPWENLGLYSEIELTPEWRDVALEVTPTKDSAGALFLNFGGDAIGIEVTELVMEPGAAAAPSP